MIVSYAGNYAFVKTRKTAGTSMEIALGSHCGPDDIITPLATEDEFTRLGQFPESLPRNFLSDPKIEESYRRAVRLGDTIAMKKFRKEKFEELYTVFNHASVRRARKVLDTEVWDKAFKFTIERHPYEKCVSMAWFRRGGGDFETVLENTVARGKYRNFDLYSLDGNLAVDFIIRYEHLKEDIKTVEEKLGGIDIYSRFPSSKGNYRGDRKPAAEHLSPDQKAKIQEVCAEEFELMGYER
jgi:hypothetical protein